MAAERGAATRLRQREVHGLVGLAERGVLDGVNGHGPRLVVAISEEHADGQRIVVHTRGGGAVAGGQRGRHHAARAAGARYHHLRCRVRLCLPVAGRVELDGAGRRVRTGAGHARRRRHRHQRRRLRLGIRVDGLETFEGQREAARRARVT